MKTPRFSLKQWFKRKPRRKRSFKEKFGRGVAFFGSETPREVPDPTPVYRTILIASAALILVLTVFFVGRVWKVNEIIADEGTYYPAAMVTTAAGIETGDRLFGFDRSAVEKRLRKQCPLMDQIHIRKQLNGTVKITFTEREHVYYTQYHVNYYFIDADTRRVLGVTPHDAEPRRVGAVYIGLPEETHVRVGDRLEFAYPPYDPEVHPEEETLLYEPETDEAEKSFAYVFEFEETLTGSSLGDRLTGMELADRYNLWIVLDGFIRVKFGSMSELGRKLHLVERVLEERNPTGELPLSVDVSDPSRIICRESDDVPMPPWADRAGQE